MSKNVFQTSDLAPKLFMVKVVYDIIQKLSRKRTTQRFGVAIRVRSA